MKTLALILIIFLFLFPIISAVEFTMKTEFQKGETLIAKVSGNFIKPILKENVAFYRGHVKVTIEPFVTKINEEFYIYARLPETQNNYSIKISGVEYYAGSQTSEDNLTREFTITNSTASFSVDKGFLVSNQDFFFEVQNLQDFSITISISQETISGDTDDFGVTEIGALKSGDTEKINFAIGDLTDPTLKMVTLSSGGFGYEIPINIYEISRESKQDAMEDKDFVDLDEEETETTIEEEGEEYIPTTTSTCAELNGIICTDTQECEAETEYAKDAPCCLGTCAEKPTTSTGKIIGWGIIIAIIGFAVWFFKFRYRGAKKEINLLAIGQGRKPGSTKEQTKSAMSRLEEFKKKFSRR